MLERKSVVWHMKVWINGRHSNIPRCCTVWFYVRVFSGWSRFLSTTPWAYRLWLRVFDNDLPEYYQYVRCPVCIVRRCYEVMHICTTKCYRTLYFTPPN